MPAGYGMPMQVVPGSALVWSPDLLTGIQHWWDFDSSRVTLDTGKIASVENMGPAGTALINATAGNRPTISSADANWNGLDVASFNGATFLYADTATPKSAWSFLHDGTGGTLIVAFRRSGTSGNHTVASTAHTASTSAGVNITAQAEALSVDHYVNSAMTRAVAYLGTASSMAGNTVPHYIIYRNKTSSTPDYSIHKDGTEVTNGSYAAGLSSADPNNVLCVGVSSDALQFFTGTVGEIIVCNEYISDAEVVLVNAYLNTRWL